MKIPKVTIQTTFHNNFDNSTIYEYASLRTQTNLKIPVTKTVNMSEIRMDPSILIKPPTILTRRAQPTPP